MSGMELKGLEALLKDRTPGLMDSKRAYAVLVPLVEQNGELCLLYEVRAKNGIAVRIIFTILPEGKVLLLYGFSKRQSRDTMRALEHSMGILAAFREHPEHAVEYKIKEEEPK